MYIKKFTNENQTTIQMKTSNVNRAQTFLIRKEDTFGNNEFQG